MTAVAVEFTPMGGGAGSGPVEPRFDGPWVRSSQEIEQMLGAVRALVDAIAAKPNRSASEVSYAERYTLGVRAAARWTVGLTARTPLSGQEVPSDPGKIGAELLAAERGVGAGGPSDGVRAWLEWLTGATDGLVLMEL